MPYIPQFNKLSLQEISYAPALMRQQHDEEVAKQMELAESLKFDYLKQDSDAIEPILQSYSTDIDDVSKQIAQQGFSHDIKNRVMGLRSKFVGDDKIHTFKKNYADAMSQWGDVRKKMLQEGRSGDDINNQKASFFSGYEGAYTKDGDKNEFTPGRTSGYYNPIEDVTKLMKGLGETGKLIGATGSSAKIVYRTDPVTGAKIPGIEVRDSQGGQVTENTAQIQEMLNSIVKDYTDDHSDRGLWATINKQDQAALLEKITGVANAHLEKKYPNLPRTDERWSPSVDAYSKKDDAKNDSMPMFGNVELDKERYEQADNDEKILTGQEKPGMNMKESLHNPYWGSVGVLRRNSKEESTGKIVNKYKSIYPKIFDGTYGDLSEVEAAKMGIEYEKAYSGMKSTMLSLKSPKIVENITNSIFNPTEEQTLEKIGDKGKGKIKSVKDLVEDFDDSKRDWKEIPPMVDLYGNVYLRDADDGIYRVNDNALDVATLKIKKEVVKPVMDQLLDPMLADKDANVPVRIPNTNLYLHVNYEKADPYNVKKRGVTMFTPTDKGNVKIKDMTPGEVFQTLTEAQRSGFQEYVK
jgi:hypothetical protein